VRSYSPHPEVYEWYERISRYRVVQCVSRYRKVIKRLFQLRLVILPDPFSWIAYLSNRLTLLTLTRCLLVDVYLYIGKLAIQAYGENEKPDPLEMDMGELEQTLEDLNALTPAEPDIADTHIREIRHRLVGFYGHGYFYPRAGGLENSREGNSRIHCKKYFPDSACPLEEAALGALLTRSQVWIKSMCETEKIPVIERFYNIKLESLYTVKSFTDGMIPRQVRTFAKKAWGMYRWMKWPLKVYRGIKNASRLESLWMWAGC